VYLLGADHSWLTQISVDSDNKVLLNQKHFYDEDSSTAKQMHKNHGKGNRQLHEVLEKFYYSFQAYHLLQSYATTRGTFVANLTQDSFIDAFPKKKIAEVI